MNSSHGSAKEMVELLKLFYRNFYHFWTFLTTVSYLRPPDNSKASLNSINNELSHVP